MDFRIVLVLCMSTFIYCSCASPAFGYPLEDEGAPNYYTMDDDTQKQPEESGPVSYKYKWTENGKKQEEEISIDKSKQTEKIHVNPDENNEEADILSDFKRKLTLYRFPASGICLLATLDESTEVPPDKLANDLEKAAKRHNPASQKVIHTSSKWYGDEVLKDRSVLSKEMTILCANLPIYKIEKILAQDAVTPAAGREKRNKNCYEKAVQRCYGCGFLWMRTCCETTYTTVCC